MYLHARPLTRESFDRYALLRQPSLLLGNGGTKYVNHVQIWYVWDMKHSPSGARCPCGLVLYKYVSCIPVVHDLCI